MSFSKTKSIKLSSSMPDSGVDRRHSILTTRKELSSRKFESNRNSFRLNPSKSSTLISHELNDDLDEYADSTFHSEGYNTQSNGYNHQGTYYDKKQNTSPNSMSQRPMISSMGSTWNIKYNTPQSKQDDTISEVTEDDDFDSISNERMSHSGRSLNNISARSDGQESIGSDSSSLKGSFSQNHSSGKGSKWSTLSRHVLEGSFVPKNVKPVTCEEHFLAPTAASKYASIRFHKPETPDDRSETSGQDMTSWPSMRSNFQKFREPSSRLISPTHSMESYRASWANRNNDSIEAERRMSRLSSIKPLDPNSHLLASGSTRRHSMFAESNYSLDSSHSSHHGSRHHMFSSFKGLEEEQNLEEDAWVEHEDPNPDREDPSANEVHNIQLIKVTGNELHNHSLHSLTSSSCLTVTEAIEEEDEDSDIEVNNSVDVRCTEQNEQAIQPRGGDTSENASITDSITLNSANTSTKSASRSRGSLIVPTIEEIQEVRLRHLDESEIVTFVPVDPIAEVSEYQASLKHHVDETEKVHFTLDDSNPFEDLRIHLRHIEVEHTQSDKPVPGRMFRQNSRVQASVTDLVKMFSKRLS